eukprot:gnl/MRDRNA2_/MRDRNA2_172243_c0_seq1.p1 gnl/MRDRNA2_/MRDRNA2_172243_c0~~gnl/MRDRNA2_/MRDRNA2_172243_c0_seq1.p1  ORF type:complete len:296 (+),score=34.56 gnl/MRDRNA2_/MRDRNA2_172243_c0_seq1:92-979(+)
MPMSVIFVFSVLMQMPAQAVKTARFEIGSLQVDTNACAIASNASSSALPSLTIDAHGNVRPLHGSPDESVLDIDDPARNGPTDENMYERVDPFTTLGEFSVKQLKQAEYKQNKKNDLDELLKTQQSKSDALNVRDDATKTDKAIGLYTQSNGQPTWSAGKTLQALSQVSSVNHIGTQVREYTPANPVWEESQHGFSFSDSSHDVNASYHMACHITTCYSCDETNCNNTISKVSGNYCTWRRGQCVLHGTETSCNGTTYFQKGCLLYGLCGCSKCKSSETCTNGCSWGANGCEMSE